jgi:K+-sensing histidine kinase KdpD
MHPVAAPSADDEILNLVAHELRRPVATLRQYAAQITPEPAEAMPAVAHIIEQADVIAERVDAILEVQRLRLGKVRFEPTLLDLWQLADSCASELRHRAPHLDIRVLARSDEVAYVEVDPVRLAQAITSLIQCGVANRALNVQIDVRRCPDRRAFAVLSVWDDSHWTQAQVMPVAVYVARAIARMHGGDIWKAGRALQLAVPLVDA